MLPSHEKLEHPQLFSRRMLVIQVAERQILQPAKIITQLKLVSKVPVIQKPDLSERSVYHVNEVDPVTKFIAKPAFSLMIPDHAKQVPGSEHASVTPKKRQDKGQEKSTYGDQNKGLHAKQLNHLHKYIQRKSYALNIDPMEHDISIHFEEHSPHQGGLIAPGLQIKWLKAN